MKKIFWAAILILTVSFIASGCTRLSITKVGPDLDKEPEGIRVYPPRVLLLVGLKYSMIHYAPDYNRAYDVKPFTFLAKHDFILDIDNGQLQSFTAFQQSMISLAMPDFGSNRTKVPSAPGGPTQIEGTFGLAPGIYEMQQSGEFKKIN